MNTEPFNFETSRAQAEEFDNQIKQFPLRTLGDHLPDKEKEIHEMRYRWRRAALIALQIDCMNMDVKALWDAFKFASDTLNVPALLPEWDLTDPAEEAKYLLADHLIDKLHPLPGQLSIESINQLILIRDSIQPADKKQMIASRLAKII